MAKAKGEAPKKSGFIREQFAKNPKISLEEMSAAWDALGVGGSISQALYYQVKRNEGYSKRRGKKRGPKPAGAVTAITAVTSTDKAMNKMEETLDSLVQQALEMRDNKLADALRTARRIASSRLV